MKISWWQNKFDGTDSMGKTKENNHERKELRQGEILPWSLIETVGQILINHYSLYCLALF